MLTINKKAFSLIEILVAVLLLASVTFFVASLFSPIRRQIDRTGDISQLQGEAVFIDSHIADSVRHSSYIEANETGTVLNGTITDEYRNETKYLYEFNSTTLTFTPDITKPETKTVLSANIQDIQFKVEKQILLKLVVTLSINGKTISYSTSIMARGSPVTQ